jgi:hypothetical protein
MKQTIIICILSILAAAGCRNTQNRLSADQLKSEADVLDFYRQYSEYTDPGEYAYVYENLPDSLEDLCAVIRTQFIHPYAELPRYRDQIPKERWDEYIRYTTVKSLLAGLLSHDDSGLTNNRKPADRLVLGCRHNALLLASVMKHRGVPARIRTGHVTYLRPGFHLSHTLCEIWNEKESRWMLVDPSMVMIDFDRNQFEFSHELWFKLQRGDVDLETYGFPGRYTGLISIVGKISPDLSAILGTEYPVFHYAPMLDCIRKNNSLSQGHIQLLNKISELMKSLNAENLSKLQEIYTATPEIQITKTFDLHAGQTKSNSGSGTPENNPEN